MKVTRVIIELKSFDHGFVVVRVPTTEGMLPVRVERSKVAAHNISGCAALAVFYKPNRRAQNSNFIPYSISKRLFGQHTFPNFGEIDESHLHKRFKDIIMKPDGDGRYLLIEYTENGRDIKVTGMATFNSIQCCGMFARHFHKARYKWKLLSRISLMDRIDSGKIKLDYSSRYTRKLVAENILPKEEQWKKDLRHGAS